MLGENTDSYFPVQASLPVLNFKFAAEGFHQRRLAGAVGPDKRDPGLAVDVDVHVAKDRFTARVANFGHVETHNVGPYVFGVRKLEAALWVLKHLISDLHLLKSLYARLYHGGALFIGSELVNKLLDVRNFLKLALSLLGLVFVALSLGFHELVEVA
jgi:hypothetical protein